MIIQALSREATTTIGTGSYSLAGASANYQALPPGVIPYVARLGADYEEGYGTVTDGTPRTLSRDRVMASSNGGAAVDWSAPPTIDLVIPAGWYQWCALPEHAPRALPAVGGLVDPAPRSIAIGEGVSAPINGIMTWGIGQHALPAGLDLAQPLSALYRGQTTDAITTKLYLDNDAHELWVLDWIAGAGRLAVAFDLRVIAMSDAADTWDHRISGTLLCETDTPAIGIVGSLTDSTISESAGAAAWSVTVGVDDLNPALTVEVTGEAATTVNWTARLEAVIIGSFDGPPLV